MSGFTSINLSKLPAPEVIETVEYEVLLAEMKDEAIRLMPDLEAYLSLESEPTTQLLRVCAYYRMLDRLAFNDGARACILALSTGANLDGLAAFWGVERLIVQEADETLRPPIPEVLESDDAFRVRVQLSLEGHSTAGPRGAYIFWTLSASGEVKDASVASPAPGEVVITVLSHQASGVASNTLLNTVNAALNDEDVRPLTDHVTVQAAEVLHYQVEATLTLFDGPDESLVMAAAHEAIEAYGAEHHRLGRDITISGLYAALHQAGVQNVNLIQPPAHIEVDDHQAAYCSNIILTVGGRDV